MKIGKHGVWCSTNALAPDQIGDLAQGVESLNYDVLWYPESMSYESLSLAGYMLGRTERLSVGSGIANIYARDGITAIAGHNTLNALYGDRFILGLGVSHIPLVETRRGHTYGKPVSTMRAYLDAIDSAEIVVKAPSRNIVLAALGPNMLALARDRTLGALPYNVTPEHTAKAKAILGPDKWLCVEQKVCLTADEKQARAAAGNALAHYMAMANYRNNWLRLGFSETELEGGGNERFLDAMVAWGDERDIRARIDAHFAAGATHVCIQPIRPDGAPGPDWNALKALAPA